MDDGVAWNSYAHKRIYCNAYNYTGKTHARTNTGTLARGLAHRLRALTGKLASECVCVSVCVWQALARLGYRYSQARAARTYTILRDARAPRESVRHHRSSVRFAFACCARVIADAAAAAAADAAGAAERVRLACACLRPCARAQKRA